MSQKKSNPTLFIIAILLPFILRYLAAMFDLPRTWGIDYLQYFSPFWQIVWTAAGLLAVPFLTGAVDVKAVTKRRTVLGLGIVVLLIAVLFVHPIEAHFYGDGQSLLAQIYRLATGAEYDLGLVIYWRSSPLSGLLVYAFAYAIPEVLIALSGFVPAAEDVIQGSAYPFVGLSFLSILILGLWYWRTQKRSSEALLLLLTYLGLGGSVLFFGYVEFYVLPYVLIFIYLVSAERALRSDANLAYPIILFLLAVAAHYMAITLLPTLLFVIATRKNILPQLTASWKALLPAALAGIALWVIAYFVLGLHDSDSRIVMPLVSRTTGAGTQAYTLLSPYHLADITNLILLLAAVPACVALFLSIREPRLLLSDESKLYVLGLVFYGAFVLFANTVFGLARDFDLVSPLGIIIALFAFHLVKSSGAAPRGAFYGVGVAAFVYTIPWVALNLDTEKSTERFEEVVRLDDEHIFGDYAISGYEALRKHYVHTGETEKEIEITRRMIELLDYPEHYGLLLNAVRPFATSAPERLTAEHRWMLERLQHRAQKLQQEEAQEDYSISRHEIDMIAAEIANDSYFAERFSDLKNALAALRKYDFVKTYAPLIAGLDAYGKGNHAITARALSEVHAAGFKTEKTYALYAASLLVTGEPSRAEEVYQEGLAAYPDYSPIPYVYGVMLIEQQRYAEARQALNHALSLQIPEDVRNQIMQILERLP